MKRENRLTDAVLRGEPDMAADKMKSENRLTDTVQRGEPDIVA